MLYETRTRYWLELLNRTRTWKFGRSIWTPEKTPSHLDQLKLGNFSLKRSEFVSPNTPGPTTSNSLTAMAHEKVGGLKLKATFQDAVKNGNRLVSKMDSIQYDLQDLCSLSLWLSDLGIWDTWVCSHVFRPVDVESDFWTSNLSSSIQVLSNEQVMNIRQLSSQFFECMYALRTPQNRSLILYNKKKNIFFTRWI